MTIASGAHRRAVDAHVVAVGDRVAEVGHGRR